MYYNCVKFHKNSISSLVGVALTRYMDGRTDGQTGWFPYTPPNFVCWGYNEWTEIWMNFLTSECGIVEDRLGIIKNNSKNFHNFIIIQMANHKQQKKIIFILKYLNTYMSWNKTSVQYAALFFWFWNVMYICKNGIDSTVVNVRFSFSICA